MNSKTGRATGAAVPVPVPVPVPRRAAAPGLAAGDRPVPWTDPHWRRTVLALAFAGAGGVLTLLAAWLAWQVLAAPWPHALSAMRLVIIGRALFAVLGLMAVVLTGLSMTVALRQVSARFMGADFSASGEAE